MSNNYTSYNDLKNNTTSKKVLEKSNAFRKGAAIGAITGFVCAYFFHGKLILWSIAGAIGGGYIGYKITDNYFENESKFTNINNK